MPLKIKHLIFWMIILPGVTLQSYNPSFEGYVTAQCELESLKFAETEDQYTDKKGKYAFQGLQNKAQDKRVYEKEKLQRTFECISNRMNGTSSSRIDMTPVFQNLMFQCKNGLPTITCDPSYRYRTFDGTCNNLVVPTLGSIQSCARRLMPASYEGVSGFRKSMCGALLPNARFISQKLLQDVHTPSSFNTNIMVLFAQFLTHDITDLSISHVGDKVIDCCSNLYQQHPQCAPILLSPDDAIYSRLNITCFNFIRAASCTSCSLGKRNQMNQPTSYIDCSNVYGLSQDESRNLRTNDGTGKMAVQYREAGPVLPPDFDLGFECGSAYSYEYCFKGGDRRVNQDAPLMSLYTLFIREHNRLAEKLKELNLLWDDETIFQEARKIVIAEMQMITYNEFLPLLLGFELMTSYNLWIGRENSRSQYSALVDPTMLMEFSTGAFRLNNIIYGTVTNFGADGNKKTLTDFIRDASTIYHDQMTMLLDGMCLTPSQKFNKYVTKEITEPSYKRHPETAFDLSATDIQRGRDSGLPSYTDVLYHISGGTINIQNFNDLKQVFDLTDVDLMKSVYCEPRDIDFIVGMYYERVKDNMMLSSTAAKIIAMQFSDLKAGDRFYFEHKGNFNDDQLRTLRDISFARILCDNSKVAFIQQYTMLLPSINNPFKRCSEILGLNMDYWKY